MIGIGMFVGDRAGKPAPRVPHISAATVAVSGLTATLSLNNTGGTIASTSTAWGDGATDGSLTHTYASAGVYTVAVSATNAGGTGTVSLTAIAGLVATCNVAQAVAAGHVWSDAGMTVPATTAGAAVLRLTDDAGVTWSFAGSGAILGNSGASWWLTIDNGNYAGASISWTGTNGTMVQRFAANSMGNILRPMGNGDNYFRWSDDGFAYPYTFRALRLEGPFTAPNDVAAHTYSITSGTSNYVMRVDGTQVASASSYWLSPTYFAIGHGSGPFKFFGAIVLPVELTGSALAAAEAYVTALG